MLLGQGLITKCSKSRLGVISSMLIVPVSDRNPCTDPILPVTAELLL